MRDECETRVIAEVPIEMEMRLRERWGEGWDGVEGNKGSECIDQFVKA